MRRLMNGVAARRDSSGGDWLAAAFGFVGRALRPSALGPQTGSGTYANLVEALERSLLAAAKQRPDQATEETDRDRGDRRVGQWERRGAVGPRPHLWREDDEHNRSQQAAGDPDDRA